MTNSMLARAAPVSCPRSVTRVTSPPKAPMLARTQRRAATKSLNARLPSAESVDDVELLVDELGFVRRKPKNKNVLLGKST